MKKLLIILILGVSLSTFSQNIYEILPITEYLQGVKIIRVLEGEDIGLYGIINSKGKLLTETNNILISVQKNHIYLVNDEYKEGMMSSDGRWIAKIGEYNFKEKYSNMYRKLQEEKAKKFFIVYTNKKPGYKYGYLNYDGKLQIPIIYDEAENFSEGLAAVKIDNKWGYIDEKGKVKIDFLYDEVSDFQNGLALVRKDDSSFYIDNNGKKLIFKSLFRVGREKIENIGYHIGSSFEDKLKIKEKTN